MPFLRSGIRPEMVTVNHTVMAEHNSPRPEPDVSRKPEPEGFSAPEIEREIPLEEFEPKGTITLTLLYFVLVVLLWIFMYFVEFAGNAPSIID